MVQSPQGPTHTGPPGMGSPGSGRCSFQHSLSASPLQTSPVPGKNCSKDCCISDVICFAEASACRPPWWSSVWFGQRCWRRLSSCFLLKGSRLNPLISFPVDYQELVCVLPSPVSWASSAFPKIQQAIESCEALMSKHRSCIWVLMGKIQTWGYFLYVGYFWSTEQWRVFIYAFRSYFQKEQCRSLCVYVSIP